MSGIATMRIKREAALLANEPSLGVTAWPTDDSLFTFAAEIEGPDASPYEHGIFRLSAQLSDRYPFEPPKVIFTTRIHHPNIDSSGRICSDVLKMPPKGCWSPKMNLNTVFAAIRLLMAEPNPDDPLENEIADEFKNNRALYFQKAQSMTKQYAVKSNISAAPTKDEGKPLAVSMQPINSTVDTLNVAAPAAESTSSSSAQADATSSMTETGPLTTLDRTQVAGNEAVASEVVINVKASAPEPLKLGGGGAKKRIGLSLSSKSKKGK
ncbi:Ubiquitin-conjugating enzyme E2 T [Chytriomyces hyalinus]|nr:Ubiquitin-conjugating enzyme E2 T [Chytriomyces hyalinus]